MKATVRSVASRPKSGMNVLARTTEGASRPDGVVETAVDRRGVAAVLRGLKKAASVAAAEAAPATT